MSDIICANCQRAIDKSEFNTCGTCGADICEHCAFDHKKETGHTLGFFDEEFDEILKVPEPVAAKVPSVPRGFIEVTAYFAVKDDKGRIYKIMERRKLFPADGISVGSEVINPDAISDKIIAQCSISFNGAQDSVRESYDDIKRLICEAQGEDVK